MPLNRRAKCPQTRYPDPKLTTLHETGASPDAAGANWIEGASFALGKMAEIAKMPSANRKPILAIAMRVRPPSPPRARTLLAKVAKQIAMKRGRCDHPEFLQSIRAGKE